MDTQLKLEDCWTGSSLTFLLVYNAMTVTLDMSTVCSGFFMHSVPRIPSYVSGCVSSLSILSRVFPCVAAETLPKVHHGSLLPTESELSTPFLNPLSLSVFFHSLLSSSPNYQATAFYPSFPHPPVISELARLHLPLLPSHSKNSYFPGASDLN